MIIQLLHTLLHYELTELNEVDRPASIKYQFDMLVRITALNCFLAAPSMVFCHIYVLCYIVSCQCLVLLRGDLSDWNFNKNLFDVPFAIFTFYFGFYVLQERELRRF